MVKNRRKAHGLRGVSLGHVHPAQWRGVLDAPPLGLGDLRRSAA
jgi:hypothetical protein